MIFRLKSFFCPSGAKTTILLSVVFFFVLFSGSADAQRRFSKIYPAGPSVRLQLINKSGTVTVIGWDRAEINITADLEAPAAIVVPQNLSGTIVINLVRDNQGKDSGSVNFTIRVPRNTLVDIETRLGNLSVKDIQSGLVRARISTEGNITLTNIESPQVAAENSMGDIFFDGEIQEGGYYRFSSQTGTIGIRIPFNSSFRVVATAPSTRNISFGACVGADQNFVGDGRRIVGKCGNGAATMTVTNQRGNIKFFNR